MRHRIRSPVTAKPYNPKDIVRAQKLRRDGTVAEELAWELLRGRRMLGLKFRRQQPIAGFVVDFYCAGERLALELDGPVHERVEQSAWDAERDATLARRGIRVIRVRNDDVSALHLEHLLFAALPPLSRRERGRG